MLHFNDKIIKHKTGLLNLAEELGNVSKAYQIMGFSRGSVKDLSHFRVSRDDGSLVLIRK